MMRNTELDQFFTPAWAPPILLREFFPDLSSKDIVVEPSAGDGRFLMAIPEHVDAYGVEIDPELAPIAAKNSGREVIQGDFLKVDLPRNPTVMIGNPPYDAKIIDGFLDRGYEAMDYGGRVGFLLPVYLFQTASRVMRYFERWSLRQALLPRNMFQNMQKPIMFATFTKERNRSMVGFLLYNETDQVSRLPKRYRYLFMGNQSRASLWGELVEQVLTDLGGEADLPAIYAQIEGNRPTENAFWKEQVRKVLRKTAVRVGPGRWRLREEESQLAMAI